MEGFQASTSQPALTLKELVPPISGPKRLFREPHWLTDI